MNHKFSAALTALPFFTILAISTPIAAQELKARDIFGVKLGATPAEVESVLKAANPKFSFFKAVYTGQGGKQGGVALITAEVSDPLVQNQMPETDHVTVQFGSSTGRVVAISRVHKDKAGFDREMVAEAMKQKYGGTFVSQNKGDIISVGYNEAGKLDKKCIDGTGAQGDSRLIGCGDTFSVNFANQHYQTKLYSWYRATLVDSKAAIDNIKSSQAKQASSDQDAARRAQEKALAAKPVL